MLTALDIALFLLVGGLFGARIFHVFYEGFDYYRERPLDIFKLWQGGFVFYGGLVGAILSGAIYLKIKGESFWSWADFFAPIGAFGYALGRVACLLNGCCFGRLCHLPWGIEFQYPGLPSGMRHPTQIYASFWELVVLIILLVLERRKSPARPTGFLFLLWILLHGVGRTLMEHFRDDYRGQLLGHTSISTWISVVLIVVASALIGRLHWLRQNF